MSRHAAEFQRLYAAGPDGASRALVLDVGRPSDWELLANAWRGVQLDLALPAPGIAIAGDNSYQLWFSLERGCPPEAAAAFFDGLKSRYLAGIAGLRIRCLTEPPVVPAEVREGQWSAFVAPDLAPVFVEATWLDIPPGAEGQADLLKSLKSITPQAWEAALAALAPRGQQDDGARSDGRVDRASTGEATPKTPRVTSAPAVPSAIPTNFTDPRTFLLHVMNDATLPMAMRIEAAKALLPESSKS
nr:hypothetical protein [uncultured Roseateles sp.]